MSLVLITGPTVEPVTLAEAKLQCALPPDDDGNHVKSVQVATRLRRAIRTARVSCENYTRRAFLTQTWQLNLDGWPYKDSRYQHRNYEFAGLGPEGRLAEIHVPKPPFQSIVSFTYVDVQGTTQTVASWGTFQTDPGSETQPARLLPPYLLPWPPTRLIANAIQLQFVAGYGDTGATVPQNINDAILLLAQYVYDGNPLEKDPPKFVRDLLDPYRNLVA